MVNCKISYKVYFALLFIVFGLILVFAVSGIYGYIYLDNQKKSIEKRAENLLESRKGQFWQFIKQAEDQVKAIARSELFLRFLAHSSEKDEVTDLFMAVARSNPALMQVRFLDVSGKETIRVEREAWGGTVAAVSGTQLQDKSRRYYFIETMRQQPGTLWHSPLDLNIEEGKVEVPYRPTIRVALPVARGGEKKGMVIVNLLMGPFLESWRQVGEFELYLLTVYGDVLLHPDRKYDRNRAKKGGKHSDPLLPHYHSDLFSARLYSPGGQDLKLLLHLRPEAQRQNWQDFTRTMGLSVFVLIGLGIMLAFFVARIPEQLYKKLHLTNEELEKKVEEKTASLKALNENLRNQVKMVLSKEQELRYAYENASRTARARSEFLGVVSHELRTPLNTLINFTELIREDFDEMLADPALQKEIRLYLERMSTNARYLLQLINNLLDISRIESGNFSYHIITAPLKPLCVEAIERIRPQAGEKGLSVSAQLLSHEVYALVDPRRFFQILLNLLANAVKFTVHGGVTVEMAERENMIEVLVRDTGRGIPEAMQDAVFHSFTQVDRFDEGTGLGLGLVKQMCTDMGIRLMIESEEGKGTTFRLQIPLSTL